MPKMNVFASLNDRRTCSPATAERASSTLQRRRLALFAKTQLATEQRGKGKLAQFFFFYCLVNYIQASSSSSVSCRNFVFFFLPNPSRALAGLKELATRGCGPLTQLRAPRRNTMRRGPLFAANQTRIWRQFAQSVYVCMCGAKSAGPGTAKANN